MPEISLVDAANLLAAGKLVTALTARPDTRRELQLLVKKINPNAPIPELDAARPVEDKIDALAKTVEELRGGLAQKEQNNALESARNVLRTKHHYTEDGIKELEKFMIETNTADHLVAHDAMQARQPVKHTARPSFQPANLFADEADDEKMWNENPDRALDRELNRAFEAIATGNA